MAWITLFWKLKSQIVDLRDLEPILYYKFRHKKDKICLKFFEGVLLQLRLDFKHNLKERYAPLNN